MLAHAIKDYRLDKCSRHCQTTKIETPYGKENMPIMKSETCMMLVVMIAM